MAYPKIKDLIYCLDHEGKNVFFRVIEIKDEELCLKTIEYLVKHGGDIKHRDSNKQTIIYFAARYEMESVVKYLLSFNFPLNDEDFELQTPIFYSAKYNRGTKVMEMLIRAGANVNHKDRNGQTCLFYSAASGNIDICRLLVEEGANPSTIDKNK